MKKREKPLNYSERRELAELWAKAAAESRAKGQTIAPQWITDVGPRAALEELREKYG